MQVSLSMGKLQHTVHPSYLPYPILTSNRIMRLIFIFLEPCCRPLWAALIASPSHVQRDDRMTNGLYCTLLEVIGNPMPYLQCQWRWLNCFVPAQSHKSKAWLDTPELPSVLLLFWCLAAIQMIGLWLFHDKRLSNPHECDDKIFKSSQNYFSQVTLSLNAFFYH